MYAYGPDMDIGVLEHWPLDNPASNYRIIRGNPVTSGRLDQGATGDRTRLGLWRCTQGAFECTELGDELQTILSGRVRLIRSDGTVREFGSGDTFFTHQGERVTWDIVEDVTKVFFGFSEGGF